MKTINLFWFKKDLRSFDNEALNEPLKLRKVIPIYVVETDMRKLPEHTSRQWYFVGESYDDIKNSNYQANLASLASLSIHNIVHIGDTLSVYRPPIR